MKRAFTLIELLVVIAIIAILAAILFPVFAQAKAAAKATASLSNLKQQSLGVIMYGGDADDNFVLGTAWNTGNDQLQYGAGLAFSTWAWSIQPYIKNAQLFMDPLATPNPARPTNQNRFDTYYVQYGYNYTYLSPDFNPGAPGKMQSTSQTAAANPAETVMLAAKWANAENTSGSDWGTAFPGGMLAAAGVDTPDCGTIPQWCLSGWGVGSFYDTTLKLKKEAGRNTGGNSRRQANVGITAFVDGHVKKMSPGALAAGTGWSETATEAQSAIIPAEKAKYLWDLE